MGDHASVIARLQTFLLVLHVVVEVSVELTEASHVDLACTQTVLEYHTLSCLCHQHSIILLFGPWEADSDLHGILSGVALS